MPVDNPRPFPTHHLDPGFRKLQRCKQACRPAAHHHHRLIPADSAARICRWSGGFLRLLLLPLQLARPLLEAAQAGRSQGCGIHINKVCPGLAAAKGGVREAERGCMPLPRLKPQKEARAGLHESRLYWASSKWLLCITAHPMVSPPLLIRASNDLRTTRTAEAGRAGPPALSLLPARMPSFLASAASSAGCTPNSSFPGSCSAGTLTPNTRQAGVLCTSAQVLLPLPLLPLPGRLLPLPPCDLRRRGCLTTLSLSLP